jgi:hypothetical protein
MKTTTEIEQKRLGYCGIEDQTLLAVLGEILVHNRIPDSTPDHEREIIRWLLAYEYEGDDGRKSYHLSVRGHLVYDLLASFAASHSENGHEEW